MQTIFRTIDYRVVEVLATIENDSKHVVVAQLEDEPLEVLDTFEILDDDLYPPF